MSEWEPTQQDLYAIHSISNTDAGKSLKSYARSEIEKHKHFLIHKCSANDAASIAYAQSAIRIGMGLIWLLEADMAELLKQHNFPPEDSDHEE